MPALPDLPITIASQDQMEFTDSEGGPGLGEEVDLGGAGGGGGTGIGLGIVDDPEPSPTEFVLREQDPELLDDGAPEYPELARMSGIEGMVVVRVLVGKDGRVKRARVVRAVHPVLDAAALAAAERYVYRPALQQRRPVAVWV